MRDRELVQRVKDATDLVALVGQAVKLRRQGSAWSGLCPFHSERTPSFQVVADRGFYHCFGCGKHGDVFTWIMEREGLTFPEALEQLARAAGIDLPRQRERPAAELDLEARVRLALETAQAFYERRLADTPKALDYLRGRGMTPDFIREAHLGYAPDAWEALVTHLKTQGFSLEVLEQAGLASRSERGSHLDFLRDRLVIPILDARGRTIAFGGRAFGDAKPKYLNTRETAVFQKGSVLFGFHRAKGQLRDGALVVEGYFDVLQLHQEGIHQAVAPLGTALTEAHLQMVGRFTKRLILCFDGDAAGLRAMEKSLRLALPLGFDVRLLLLPQGEDPDTWCMTLGRDAFRELISRAPGWTDFIIGRALEGKDLRRTTDRMEALRDLAGFLTYLPASPEQRELFASLAHELRVPLEELDKAVKARFQAPAEEPAALAPPPAEVDDLVRPVLRLAKDPAFLAQLAQAPPAWWEALRGAPLVQCVLDAGGDDFQIPEGALAQIRAIEAGWSAKDDAELVPDLVLLKLEMAYVEREKQTLARQLQDPAVATDPDLTARITEKVAGLLARGAQLRASLKDLRRRALAR
ncbi:DNA primase [Mesoterricola sediminis]|uniref:DNA primase n=1 Tax=Mesoterricola sediminis TaxID=2927980 RepID=A0AA48KDW2_9BACT|nr:DNA primase [Mesoterricola sediminis]BDU76732.1 DNA primase [Mesoterricola sediminis]